MATDCRLLVRAIVLSALGALMSCAGEPTTPEEGDTSELPRLQGRFAEEGVEHPLDAIEAFVGDEEFFVSYDTGEGVVYAGGNWADRIDLARLEELDSDG